jgi:uncharacterized membrane protein YfcA
MKILLWMIGIPVALLLAIATGTIIVVPGFLIAAFLIWVIKKCTSNWQLGLWLLLFSGCPLSVAAATVVNLNIPIEMFGVLFLLVLFGIIVIGNRE